MSFVRHRSSTISHHDRLSYLHGPDQEYKEYIHTFDPRKNLNELFQSISVEDVQMENLRVYLRVRPSLEEETHQDEDTKVEILNEHSVTLTAPACSNTFKNSTRGITNLSHRFTFTHIYGPATTQEELFHSSTLGLVNDFISGQNCLLFTYGATNSGKTFTVQGTPGDAGLLPRTLQHIFTTIGEHQYSKNDLKPKFFCNVIRLEEQDILKEEEKRENVFKITSNLTTTFSQSMSLLKTTICEESSLDASQMTETSRVSNNTTEAGVSPALESDTTTSTTARDSASPRSVIYAVFVSFAEIYNEYIYDLLERIPTSKGNKRSHLMLGEDRNGSIYIKGLNEVRVRTVDEAFQLLTVGRQNLHFAATRLNHNSSRSHCVFTVKLVRLADADRPHVARVSMLSLCDLAGSERAAKTMGTQDRLKETGNINTSLLTLSRCIEALRYNQTQRGSKKVPVPYRDSKLTRLFQSFFLGRGKAAMIVNISKTPLLFDETLQVLKFSAIAKQIAISQTKESDVKVLRPSKRMNQLSKLVRQSLSGSGRLSVPWEEGAVATTFGASVCEEKEELKEKQELEEEEDEDEDDEMIEALIQQIGNLKEELLREHKEKVELEERLRKELCKEFSQQLVEIQNSWGQRLRDQEKHYEELTESKVQALMKSVKKCNKRVRSDEDPDEEYVSSVLLFREQQTVMEQRHCIEELETSEKLLEDQVKALKLSQKRTSELMTQAQEENSRLTFRLAQLTQNYDTVVLELKEAKALTSSNGDFTLDMQKLRTQIEAKNNQLTEQNQEIKELQSMLVEASECYTNIEGKCLALEKMMEKNDIYKAQQVVRINELESQLNGARDMLGLQAEQIEEREQDIEDLRQLLSQEKNTKKQELEAKEQEKNKMEEEHLRGKSKLLLEVAFLKRNRPLQGSSGDSEAMKELQGKVISLQEEKEALEKSGERRVKLLAANENHRVELEEKISRLQEEKKELIEDKESKEKLLTTSEKHRLEFEEKISKLQEEKEELVRSEERREKVLAEFEKNIEELEENLSKVQEEKEGLERREKTLAEDEKHILEVEERLSRLLEEKEDLEQRVKLLAEGEKHRLKLEERLSRLQEEKEEIEKSEERLREKQHHLREKLSSVEEKHKLEVEELLSRLQEEKERLSNSIEALSTQLDETQSILKEKLDAEARFQEKLGTCETDLKELQKTMVSLNEEKESLNIKLQDQTEIMEKLKAEIKEEIKNKGEYTAKNGKLHDELSARVEELQKMSARLEGTAKEVCHLQDVNGSLEAQLKEMKAEKCQYQTKVEMLELDKKMMTERLHNQVEANLIKADHAQIEICTMEAQKQALIKEKVELQFKLEKSLKLCQEQTSLVSDKQEVIKALSSKLESLDAKLSRTDKELAENNQIRQELGTAREKVTSQEMKLDVMEKEIRALREARQEEVLESSVRERNHEETVRLKNEEISTLQQEVKKLLSLSTGSTRSSVFEAVPPVKDEASSDSYNDVITIREQLRLTAAHNSTLIQEVSTLRNQLDRLSTTSENLVLQVSASESSKKDQRDTITSEVDSFITPVTRGRRGKGKTKLVSLTPSDTSHMLESSVGQDHISPCPSPAPTNSKGRPQRATRRNTKYDSEEYVLNDTSEDKTWRPSQKVSKGSRHTKSKKSKGYDPPNPHLKDQENKSSMANNADDHADFEESQLILNKKAIQRGRRTLYSTDQDEPYLCAPDKVMEMLPEDSPHTTVRRHLRNKLK